MNQTANPTMVLPQLGHMFPVPHARSFVTVVISTLALILACLLFAPSSVTWGALSGSLPFAAIKDDRQQLAEKLGAEATPATTAEPATPTTPDAA